MNEIIRTTNLKFILESKDRFIKGNRNLTNAQKKELIDFFRVNRQAEKDVDWSIAKKMTYDDFLIIKLKYTSGRKGNNGRIQCPDNLKGLTKNEDYIHLKLKNPQFCAYIPLSWKTAKQFNTDKVIGVCSGDWCIGHSQTPEYWDDHVVDDKEIPVYVVNDFSKWVVMIHPGNRKYDVWDVDNKYEKIKQGIPNFSIRKELLTPKYTKIYDDIREELERESIDISDAISAYELLVSDMEQAHSEYSNAMYEYNERINDIVIATKDQLIDEYNDTQSEIEELDDDKEELELLLQDDPEYDEYDEEYYYRLRGEDFTEEEIEEFIKEKEDEIDELIDKRDDIDSDIKAIDMVEYYWEYKDIDIEWVEEFPDEEYIEEMIYVPSVYDVRYNDYISVMEEYYDYDLEKYGDYSDEKIQEYVFNHMNITAESALEEGYLEHPEVVNERRLDEKSYNPIRFGKLYSKLVELHELHGTSNITAVLNESKDRFIKNNRNLTKEQKKEIIEFFRKNRQAEKDVDWNTSKNMTYDDFLDIKIKYQSGRKTLKKMKCQDKRIKELKNGEDYINIKIRNPHFCAYIPLSWETAQKFNRDDYIGSCSGDWCIGSTLDASNWNSYIVDQNDVPIYLVDNTGNKWVLMVDVNNSKIEVWDTDNDFNKTKQEVPGIKVRKVFLTPSLKNLYNEIRFKYFDEYEVEEGLKEAAEERDQLLYDIMSTIDIIDKNMENFNEVNEKTLENTIRYYEGLLEKETNEEKKSEYEEILGELEDYQGSYYEMYDSNIDWKGEVISEEDIFDVEYPELSNYEYYYTWLEDNSGIPNGYDYKLRDIIVDSIYNYYDIERVDEMLNEKGFYNVPYDF